MRLFKKRFSRKDASTAASAKAATVNAGARTGEAAVVNAGARTIESPGLEEQGSTADAGGTSQISQVSAQTSQEERQPLWSRAYSAALKEDKSLVCEYEQLLSEHSKRSKYDGDDYTFHILKGIGKSAEEGNGRSESEQMIAVAERMAQQKKDSQIKYSVFGLQCTLQEQVRVTANFIIQIKGFVGEALKASPEASLVWAGVSLILPLLTNHTTASSAHSSGLEYVSSRIPFYRELELLLKNKYQMQDKLVQLYKLIILFQLESIKRCLTSRGATIWHDIVHESTWGDKLAEIKSMESEIRSDLKTVGSLETPKLLEAFLEQSEHQDMRQRLVGQNLALMYVLTTAQMSVGSRGTHCQHSQLRQLAYPRKTKQMFCWDTDDIIERNSRLGKPAYEQTGVLAYRASWDRKIHGYAVSARAL